MTLWNFNKKKVTLKLKNVHLSNNSVFRGLRGVGKKRKCLHDEPMNAKGVSVDNA